MPLVKTNPVAQRIKKKRGFRTADIMGMATALGIGRVLLWQVIHGKRRRPEILARYTALSTQPRASLKGFSMQCPAGTKFSCSVDMQAFALEKLCEGKCHRSGLEITLTERIQFRAWVTAYQLKIIVASEKNSGAQSPQ
jgi:hypothetical protein